jgi:hypothetical protein
VLATAKFAESVFRELRLYGVLRTSREVASDGIISGAISDSSGDVVDKKEQAQWWVAFSLDPSARPPEPQGALSAGWADVSPIFAPTAEGAEALCVFETDYEATTYMHSLSAQRGGSHPIITEGLNSRQDLERIAERFDVRYVAVNPSLAGEAEAVVPLGEFLDRLS